MFILSHAGHEVRTAASGRVAIEIAIEFEPNVVLLDIGLPDMTGYEVASTLRSIENLAGVRLIAISGYDTPEAARARCRLDSTIMSASR